ncbi:hypothetical protein BC477_20315 [Clavibacter michiganensis subsp. michiganensis]|uniref:Uncharacterized protein n=1 Tax=Clavibacter michiganensis subsp. michiganensis TaxID=33013 RepID=A0A251XDX8_CLAMM|nr:hypothetical protein BC477_20315 [Clavibacter michiganensis subsp. michiganensis]OUE00048.1 hypothetical protein CMMCAS07_19855 [Clavibacter michiganensis subsp. michiganensis]
MATDGVSMRVAAAMACAPRKRGDAACSTSGAKSVRRRSTWGLGIPTGNCR